MNAAVVVAALGLAGVVLSAVLSYRTSRQVNTAALEASRVAERQVDGEAYARSQGFYEKLLSEADRHLDRLRTQIQLLGEDLERVSKQLADEQAANDLLRCQVRQLHERVNAMERQAQALIPGHDPDEQT